jgi:hypothetical protein
MSGGSLPLSRRQSCASSDNSHALVTARVSGASAVLVILAFIKLKAARSRQHVGETMRPDSRDADDVRVRSVNRLLFLLALTVACQRPAARPSADSQRFPNPATPATATVQPVQAAAPLSFIPAEPRQVCDSVAQGWREVSFSHVELRDTVANPVN